MADTKNKTANDTITNRLTIYNMDTILYKKIPNKYKHELYVQSMINSLRESNKEPIYTLTIYKSYYDVYGAKLITEDTIEIERSIKYTMFPDKENYVRCMAKLKTSNSTITLSGIIRLNEIRKSDNFLVKIGEMFYNSELV